MNQTWALVLLSTAAALLGTVLGGVLGSTIGGVTDPSGWGPLIGAIFGIMLGVPLAEVTLVFLWAKRYRRVLWIPPVAMFLVFGVATLAVSSLISRVKFVPLSNLYLALESVVALGLAFVIGRWTPLAQHSPNASVTPPATPA